MTRHETPQQRYRRLKADKLRHSQIAPLHPQRPARCVCGQARLMHAASDAGPHAGRCVAFGCGCTEYREVEE